MEKQKKFALSHQGRLLGADGPLLDAEGEPVAFASSLFYDTDADLATPRALHLAALKSVTAAQRRAATQAEPTFTWEALTFPAGAVVILATAQKGKSTLMRSVGPSAYVEYGEPTATSLPHDPTLFSRVVNQLCTSDSEVVAIDSLKAFLLTLSSNLGPGGLSKSALLVVEDLSRAFAQIGRLLIVSINPFDMREGDVPGFFDALSAVSAGVVWLRERSGSRVTASYTSRAADRATKETTLELGAARPPAGGLNGTITDRPIVSRQDTARMTPFSTLALNRMQRK